MGITLAASKKPPVSTRVFRGDRNIEDHLLLTSRDTKVPRTFLNNSVTRCVSIKTSSRVETQGAAGEPLVKVERSTASGVVLVTGYVATNYHVISESTDRILVNGHEAELIHFDIASDLAFLYVKKSVRVKEIDFTHGIRKTAPVYYVGNPEDLSKSAVQGAVTKVSEMEIITDIGPGFGMSGCGMYCKQTGALVGIVDHYITGTTFTVAVPAKVVMREFERAKLIQLKRSHAIIIQESLKAEAAKPLPPVEKIARPQSLPFFVKEEKD